MNQFFKSAPDTRARTVEMLYKARKQLAEFNNELYYNPRLKLNNDWVVSCIKQINKSIKWCKEQLHEEDNNYDR